MTEDRNRLPRRRTNAAARQAARRLAWRGCGRLGARAVARQARQERRRIRLLMLGLFLAYAVIAGKLVLSACRTNRRRP